MLQEFYTFVVFTVSWLIAAIVAAAYGSDHASIAASAVRARHALRKIYRFKLLFSIQSCTRITCTYMCE